MTAIQDVKMTAIQRDVKMTAIKRDVKMTYRYIWKQYLF